MFSLALNAVQVAVTSIHAREQNLNPNISTHNTKIDYQQTTSIKDVVRLINSQERQIENLNQMILSKDRIIDTVRQLMKDNIDEIANLIQTFAQFKPDIKGEEEGSFAENVKEYNDIVIRKLEDYENAIELKLQEYKENITQELLENDDIVEKGQKQTLVQNGWDAEKREYLMRMEEALEAALQETGFEFREEIRWMIRDVEMWREEIVNEFGVADEGLFIEDGGAIEKNEGVVENEAEVVDEDVIAGHEGITREGEMAQEGETDIMDEILGKI